jgi:hypothetical protein
VFVPLPTPFHRTKLQASNGLDAAILGAVVARIDADAVK